MQFLARASRAVIRLLQSRRAYRRSRLIIAAAYALLPPGLGARAIYAIELAVALILERHGFTR